MSDLPVNPTKTDHILALGRGLLRPTVVMLLSGAVVYLSVVGKPVPEILGALVSMVIGYYFGSRTAEKSNAAVPAATPAMTLPVLPTLPPGVQQAIDAIMAPAPEAAPSDPAEGRTSV